MNDKITFWSGTVFIVCGILLYLSSQIFLPKTYYGFQVFQSRTDQLSENKRYVQFNTALNQPGISVKYLYYEEYISV